MLCISFWAGTDAWPTRVYCRMNNAGINGESSVTRYVRGVNNSSLIMSPSPNCLPISARWVANRAWIWLLSPSSNVRCVNFTFWVLFGFVSSCCKWSWKPVFRDNTERTGSTSSGRSFPAAKDDINFVVIVVDDSVTSVTGRTWSPSTAVNLCRLIPFDTV